MAERGAPRVIRFPKYHGGPQDVVKQGFAQFGLDTDALNPDLVVTGPELTEGWVDTLGLKCRAKNLENDGFPETWSRDRKVLYMMRAERQNDVRDLTTAMGRKCENYWLDKKIKNNKPDLDTTSGSSVALFGQSYVHMEKEDEPESTTLSEIHQRFILDIAGDPSLLGSTIENIIRIDNIIASGSGAFNAKTGEPENESWIEYDETFNRELEDDIARAADWKTGLQCPVISQISSDEYISGDDEDEATYGYGVDEENASGDWSDYVGTKEEIRAAMEADKAEEAKDEEAKERKSRAMQVIENDDNYDDVDLPDVDLSDVKVSKLTSFQNPDPDPKNFRLTREEEIEVSGYIKKLNLSGNRKTDGNSRVDKNTRHGRLASDSQPLLTSSYVNGEKKKKPRRSMKKSKDRANLHKNSRLGNQETEDEDVVMGEVDDSEEELI